MNTKFSPAGDAGEDLEAPPLTLGWRLRMAIETAGLTSEELGDMLGVSGMTVRRWTKDTNRPKKAYLLQIALYCRVPSEWLITGKIPAEVIAAEVETDAEAGRSDNPRDTDWLPQRIKKTSRSLPSPTGRKVA